jgi:hypothetical protein
MHAMFLTAPPEFDAILDAPDGAEPTINAS